MTWFRFIPARAGHVSAPGAWHLLTSTGWSGFLFDPGWTPMKILNRVPNPERHDGAGICLCMIVRDEAHVLPRCLESVLAALPLASWAVVDTGSTDGTPEVVRRLLGHLPGLLEVEPWTDDFAHHRNHALALATQTGAAWAFVIDADEVLSSRTPLPDLQGDGYLMAVQTPETIAPRFALLRLRAGWAYEGARHETPVMRHREPVVARLSGWTIDARALDGARTLAGGKYSHDAEVLRKLVEANPMDGRAWFYLGMTCSANQDVQGAIHAFANAAQWTTDPQEQWVAIYATAALSEDAGDACEDLYRRAWALCPRAEAAGRYALWLLRAQRFAEAIDWARRACAVQPETHWLHVEVDWYRWMAQDVLYRALFCSGDYGSAINTARELLQRDTVNAGMRPEIEANLDRMIAVYTEGLA